MYPLRSAKMSLGLQLKYSWTSGFDPKPRQQCYNKNNKISLSILAISHVNMKEPTLSIMIYIECTSDNGQFITWYRNNESVTVTNDQRIARLKVQIFQTKVSHLDRLHSVELKKNPKWKVQASCPSICLEKVWRTKKPRTKPWWWGKKWYLKYL
jgi:hypothetical protein